MTSRSQLPYRRFDGLCRQLGRGAAHVRMRVRMVLCFRGRMRSENGSTFGGRTAVRSVYGALGISSLDRQRSCTTRIKSEVSAEDTCRQNSWSTHSEKDNSENHDQNDQQTSHPPPRLSLILVRRRQLVCGGRRVLSYRSDIRLDIV